MYPIYLHALDENSSDKSLLCIHWRCFSVPIASLCSVTLHIKKGKAKWCLKSWSLQRCYLFKGAFSEPAAMTRGVTNCFSILDTGMRGSSKEVLPYPEIPAAAAAVCRIVASWLQQLTWEGHWGAAAAPTQQFQQPLTSVRCQVYFHEFCSFSKSCTTGPKCFFAVNCKQGFLGGNRNQDISLNSFYSLLRNGQNSCF